MPRPSSAAWTLRALAYTFFALAVFAVAGPMQANAQEPTRLAVGTTADVVNLNPLVGNSRSDTWVTNLMYPRLMQMSASGQKEPYVATDWGYSDDGLTAWMELRDDMMWSDGEPFTADDVAFTITAVTEEAIGITAGLVGGSFERARAVSPTRVEFDLTQRDGQFLTNMGFWMPIVPEHVFPEVGQVSEFANDSDWVSAGPFVMTSVERGQRYVLEAVETYPFAPGGRAAVDEVVFRVFPDVNAQALALRAGDLDLIANAIPPAIARALSADPSITLVEIPALGWAHMQYNLERPPLDDLAVRQALAHAVDYEAIRRIALQGQAGSTLSSVISPVLSFWHDDTIEEYTYDPERARALLEAAGYADADGDGFYDGITFGLLYDQAAAEIANWAQIVRDSSAEAGIEIELTGLERNTYRARARDRDHDIYAGSWSIMEEPAAYLDLAFRDGGFINYGNVSDPEIERLLDEAQAATSPEEALGPVQAIARRINEQVYDNVLYYQEFQFAYNSDRWEGFVPQPSDLLSLVNPLSLASVHPVD